MLKPKFRNAYKSYKSFELNFKPSAQQMKMILFTLMFEQNNHIKINKLININKLK